MVARGSRTKRGQATQVAIWRNRVMSVWSFSFSLHTYSRKSGSIQKRCRSSLTRPTTTFQTDIVGGERAIQNSEWKSATMLAGSDIEAPLRWERSQDLKSALGVANAPMGKTTQVEEDIERARPCSPFTAGVYADGRPRCTPNAAPLHSDTEVDAARAGFRSQTQSLPPQRMASRRVAR
jgi:hypothetical protein